MNLRSLLAAVLLCGVVPAAVLAADPKPHELKVGTFAFQMSPAWVAKAEPRMMSAGGFTLAGKEGADPVEADFYHFGAGQGGGVEPNLRRWQSQFQPGPDGTPPALEREELAVGDRKAMIVTLKGTFLSGPAMAPKKVPKAGYAMLGAILPSPDGDVFIKITGPEAATLAVKEEVKAMVKAAFAK